MDIDSEYSAYDFSSTFPLPFRVLFLSFSTILAFATNLHFLSYIGIDTSLVLDIRLEDSSNRNSFNSLLNDNSSSSSSSSRLTTPFVHPSKLYSPIYKLSLLGLLWTSFGWLIFNKITGGDPIEMVKWRIIPAFIAFVVGVATIAPWNVLYQKERFMFLRSLKRTILSPLNSAVPFSDIILADILTSSAKVLGDVWVSGCLLLSVTENFGVGTNDLPSGCARIWMVPVMTSLPYLFRFRQCLSEVVSGSTPTPDKSIMNAIKYASAFPVIFFSALQTVTGDPYHDLMEGEDSSWIGRDLVFTLWILSVLVNSLYSFWWDVTNDWGLSLLTPTGWSNSPSISYAFMQPSTGSNSRSRSISRPVQRGSASRTWGSGGNQNPLLQQPSALPNLNLNLGLGGSSSGSGSNGLGANDFGSAPLPSRPHTPEIRLGSPSKALFHNSTNSIPNGSGLRPSSSSNNSSTSSSFNTKAYSTSSNPNTTFPFLRPILLLPDPYLYYLAILIDLILRFTWSLKLSSHLHSIHEIESGIFLMEALEVLRRWMWVFLRIEWEAVRKGAGGGGDSRGEGGSGSSRLEEEEMELGERNFNGDNYRDVLEYNNNNSPSSSRNNSGTKGTIEVGRTGSGSGNRNSASSNSGKELGLGIIS